MFIIKTLCVLLFVSVCPYTATENRSSLDRIKWYGVNNILDPPTLILQWDEVKSVDEHDPVIGYKVNIWEVKKIKRIKNIEHENGTIERVEVEEYPRAKRINGTNVIPEGKMRILEAPVDNRTVSFGIKLEVPYQFTVTAYTRMVEGPPSAIAGVTVHGADWKSQYEI